MKHDNPLLDLFLRLPTGGESHTRLSHPVARNGSGRIVACTYIASIHAEPSNFSSTARSKTEREREKENRDAVSRDCSRLQLLAACSVSRGGTTSDLWAMSAAMEAAGNHVPYRAVRQRSRQKEKERRTHGVRAFAIWWEECVIFSQELENNRGCGLIRHTTTSSTGDPNGSMRMLFERMLLLALLLAPHISHREFKSDGIKFIAVFNRN